jgi:cytidine deaminase
MQDFSILLDKATHARLNAYAPYSHFLVGSCVETASGQLFAGCNVENASYGLTVCAESNAITAMVTGGEQEIKQILVLVKGPGVSGLCGACRQRLNEFASPDTVIHLCDLAGTHQTYTLHELLPHAFGPRDLAKQENNGTSKQ